MIREIISDWIVKLQTPLDSELKMNEETGDYYLVYHHTQHEFTIAEVLQQICIEEYNLFKFDDMMLNNVIVRM